MASQEEFVLMHIDGIEATGFVEHLKLPLRRIQSILQGMRRRQDRHAAATTEERRPCLA
ncbi:MAG: carbon-phosphorus lyase complex subunit PhnI [Dehalococcoidia bacterium]|nr:carbon-phosphorus lyase complex subunit PhnI [Dehalococcoidia bacterium]